MNNSENSYNPLEDSPNKNKLPLEVSVSTLISVFFRRFLPLFIALIIVMFFTGFVWLLADYAQIMSAILLGITVTIVLLFIFSLFRRRATPFDKLLKRLFDILLGLSSIVLQTPVLALVALIIKLDSKGPAIILQKRLGKDGKAFNVFKFRTMYINADKIPEKHISLKNDPRVTKVGRFLRRSSLDELPQLFNVLRGEMSLVGPRPLINSELEFYTAEYYETYMKMKPGITGLWQVGSKTNSQDERKKLDEYYVNNWYLWMDFKILAKTVFVAFSKQGAY